MQQKGHQTAVVGAGADLHNAFLGQGLVDELIFNVAPVLEGKGLHLMINTDNYTLKMFDFGSSHLAAASSSCITRLTASVLGKECIRLVLKMKQRRDWDMKIKSKTAVAFIEGWIITLRGLLRGSSSFVYYVKRPVN